MKRFVYTYLIGLAACVISISTAYRPKVGRWNLLFAAVLGISSRMADAAGRRMVPAYMALVIALLSSLFVLAEALRSRDSWLRWLGYGLWVLLAVATFVWVAPPNI
jgi:hypothetical protein